LHRELKVKEIHGRDAGYDDRGRRRETFENVVGVFDDDRYEETAECLERDYRPHDDVIAVEKPGLLDLKLFISHSL